MKYRFVIKQRLPSLNDYIDVCRFNKYQAAAFKKRIDKLIYYEMLSQIKGLQITKQVIVHIHFVEENKKRDVDNVYSASKIYFRCSCKNESSKKR